MKFFNFLLVLLMFFTTSAPGYSSGVLCNSNRSVCTVGKYTLRGPNLYVKDGIMCTSNRSICTNGYAILRTGAVNKKKDKTEDNNKTNTNQKKENTVIVQISEAEELKMLTDLYEKRLINQSEFNRLKSNLMVIQADEIEELKKIANLYENGFITQFEYNKYKSDIFRE